MRTDTKMAVIAKTFTERSLNRFEAERIGDHCLHSTVSGLEKLGCTFHRKWEKVPTRFGKETRVIRYSLLKIPDYLAQKFE